MPANPTLTALRRLLKKRFKGVLTMGSHQENGECCALEAISVLRGLPWTDDPQRVRSFDLRPLNDMDVPDEVRTKHLLPVLAAYDGSLDWPTERQQAVATALVIGVVNVLIAKLAGLPAEIANACLEATTKEQAAASASAAAWSAARSAAAASAAASAAAWSAAESAAARERVFIAACKVWMDAARK